MSAPSEDWESLTCSVKESLSSSAPRSGEVEEELLEEPVDVRWVRRARAMMLVEWGGVEGVMVVVLTVVR